MKLSSTSLSAISGVRHAFFTREGGVSEGIYASLNGGIGSNDDPAHVSENRRRMAAMLGVDVMHFLTAYQVHSPDVVIAEKPWTGDGRPKVDAMVTRVPGLALGVTAADCGPVLFVDPKARVIGAAHAGWKGAFSGVLDSTIAAMVDLGAARGNIIAAIGPLIRQQSYEVGPEFVARFVDADAGFARFFNPSIQTGHSMFDLGGFIRMRLKTAGVTEIDDLGIDTYCDPRFFSYRRSVHRNEGDYGRQIHALVLES